MTTDFVAQAITNYRVVINNIDGSQAFDMSADIFPQQKRSIPFLKPDIKTGDVMSEFNLISNITGCPTCQGKASAAFVGNQAQGVITTYSIRDTNKPTKGANGAAVLVRP